MRDLARETERRITEFDAQVLANTAWALATMKQADKKLFTLNNYNGRRRP